VVLEAQNLKILNHINFFENFENYLKSTEVPEFLTELRFLQKSTESSTEFCVS
jgi:hypothetical protein